MRRLFASLVVMAGLAGAVDAVIVDRVAISVGNKVITQSEIRDRIRLTAFQNGEQPDFSAESRKAAAEKLIDQRLVEHEMQVGHYPTLTEKEAGPLVDTYRKEHFHSSVEFETALRQHTLTLADLQQDLVRQADLLNFLSLRFRPAVQVTDEEVRKYYQQHAPRSNTVTLNDLRAAIEDRLTAEHADQELEAWLKDQRRRTKIEYHPEAFE